MSYLFLSCTEKIFIHNNYHRQVKTTNAKRGIRLDELLTERELNEAYWFPNSHPTTQDIIGIEDGERGSHIVNLRL